MSNKNSLYGLRKAGEKFSKRVLSRRNQKKVEFMQSSCNRHPIFSFWNTVQHSQTTRSVFVSKVEKIVIYAALTGSTYCKTSRQRHPNSPDCRRTSTSVVRTLRTCFCRWTRRSCKSVSLYETTKTHLHSTNVALKNTVSTFEHTHWEEKPRQKFSAQHAIPGEL